jgi:hypothetical protein
MVIVLPFQQWTPQKDAPRSVSNRCGERFPAPSLTRRAEDERCRGSPADRTGVSNERPSGRCDAGGHWVPAQRSTSWLGAPEAGDPWGASGLSVATHRRYLKTCAARAFRDRDFDKNPKSRGGGIPRSPLAQGERDGVREGFPAGARLLIRPVGTFSPGEKEMVRLRAAGRVRRSRSVVALAPAGRGGEVRGLSVRACYATAPGARLGSGVSVSCRAERHPGYNEGLKGG